MPTPRTVPAASAHRWREFAHRLLLAAALVLPAAAQEPAPAALAEVVDAAAVRTLAAEAERLIDSGDAEVRGEAALLLAATGERQHHDAVLAVARDKEAPARLRGLLALGLLGAPGSGLALEQVLADSPSRVHADGIVAAFALGIMPADSATDAIGRYLARVLQSNYHRQHDALAALLVGLGGRPHASQAAALLRLLDDDANRDAGLRAQLLLAIDRAGQQFDHDRLQRLLANGVEVERLAALQVLLDRDDERDDWLPTVVRLQAGDASAEVRAAALGWLTQARHLPALDLAARAIKTGQPAEVEQGVRTALRLGGGGMRRAIAEHILACRQPAQQTRMLRAYDAVADREFAEQCRGIAADRGRPLPLRAEAALCAARALGADAAPVLRDLVAADLDAATLVQLLRALAAAQPELPPLASLFPAERCDLSAMPQHVRALLLTQHKEALRFLLAQLSGKAPAKAKAALLRAARLALAPPPPPAQLALLPEVVRGLLQ